MGNACGCHAKFLKVRSPCTAETPRKKNDAHHQQHQTSPATTATESSTERNLKCADVGEDSTNCYASKSEDHGCITCSRETEETTVEGEESNEEAAQQQSIPAISSANKPEHQIFSILDTDGCDEKRSLSLEEEKSLEESEVVISGRKRRRENDGGRKPTKRRHFQGAFASKGTPKQHRSPAHNKFGTPKQHNIGNKFGGWSPQYNVQRNCRPNNCFQKGKLNYKGHQFCTPIWLQKSQRPSKNRQTFKCAKKKVKPAGVEWNDQEVEDVVSLFLEGNESYERLYGYDSSDFSLSSFSEYSNARSQNAAMEESHANSKALTHVYSEVVSAVNDQASGFGFQQQSPPEITPIE